MINPEFHFSPEEEQVPILELGQLPVRQTVHIETDNARLGPVDTDFKVISVIDDQPLVEFEKYEGMQTTHEPVRILGSYPEKSWPGKRDGKFPEDFATGLIIPGNFMVIRGSLKGPIVCGSYKINDWRLGKLARIRYRHDWR